MQRTTAGVAWGGAVVGSGETVRQVPGATVRLLFSRGKLFVHRKLLAGIGDPDRITFRRDLDGVQRLIAVPEKRGWKLTYVRHEAHCLLTSEGAALLGVTDECRDCLWVGAPDLVNYAGNVYLCIVIRPQSVAGHFAESHYEDNGRE